MPAISHEGRGAADVRAGLPLAARHFRVLPVSAGTASVCHGAPVRPEVPRGGGLWDPRGRRGERGAGPDRLTRLEELGVPGTAGARGGPGTRGISGGPEDSGGLGDSGDRGDLRDSRVSGVSQEPGRLGHRGRGPLASASQELTPWFYVFCGTPRRWTDW